MLINKDQFLKYLLKIKMFKLYYKFKKSFLLVFLVNFIYLYLIKDNILVIFNSHLECK